MARASALLIALLAPLVAHAGPATYQLDRSLASPGRSPLPSYTLPAPGVPSAPLTPPPVISAGAGPIRLTGSPGGNLNAYRAWIEQIRASGRKVIVDGQFYSGAALVMTLPPGQACATPRAAFHVHAATLRESGEIHEGETAAILNSYPAPARAVIARKGGLTRAFIRIQASDVLPICAPLKVNP